MKIIDKNFRLFGKLSIVDLLLILVVIAGIFVALQFSAPQTVSAKPGDTKLLYTVEFYKKDPSYKDKIKPGDKIYDSMKGYAVGTVKEVYALPYQEDVGNFAENRIERATVEGYEYVYVVIEANAQITEAATMVGQYEVMVGKDVYLKGSHFASSGFAVKMEKGATE